MRRQRVCLAVLLVLGGALVIAGCSRHHVRPQVPTALPKIPAETTPVETTPRETAEAPETAPASPSLPDPATLPVPVDATRTADEKNVPTGSSARSGPAPTERASPSDPDRAAVASSRSVPGISRDAVLSPTAVAHVYSAGPAGGQGAEPSPASDRPSSRDAQPPSATSEPAPEEPAGTGLETGDSATPESDPHEPSGPAEHRDRVLRLSVSTSNPTPAVGEVVLVDVEIMADSPVADAPFRLRYDPAVLEFVDAAPGEFLARGMSSVVFLADAAGRHGEVAIAIGRTERSTGAEGNGLLCRVRLQASAPGQSDLVLLDPMVWDADGIRLEVMVSGSQVVVH